MKLLATIKRRWDLILASAAAVAAALIVTPASLSSVTGELVTFFGIQAAVLLPAMLLTATILRPDGLSPKDVRRYRGALHGQMTFWSVLLLLDFLAVALVIAGKLTGWIFTLYVPSRGWVDTSELMVAVTSFVGALAIIRMIPAVIGIFSLMKLNVDLVGKAVDGRAAEVAGERRREATPFETPADYGRVIAAPKIQ